MRTAAFGGLDRGDEFLTFLKQYGVDDVVFGAKQGPVALKRFPPESAEKPGSHWQLQDLIDLRKRCENIGLRFAAIENPVPPWNWDLIMLGKPGRDQQIENIAGTIRNMGRAEIPIMGYHWMVNQPGMTRAALRTSFNVRLRGDSKAEDFDMEVAKDEPLYRDRVYTEEEMWEYYEYFVKAIVPVLEESGVKMALHPDDPVVESLGGMPRLFRNQAGYDRAMEIADSPNSGLNFCLGNWTAMGVDIPAAVRHFGSQGKIFYGHVQGVRGTVPRFEEVFVDEADCDFLEVIKTMDEVGVDSFLIPAHFPYTINDTKNQHHGHAFAIGYLAGLYRAARVKGN